MTSTITEKVQFKKPNSRFEAKENHHAIGVRGRVWPRAWWFSVAKLFLNFFVNSRLSAPFTKLRKFNLSFHFSFILARPVINSFTVLAGEFYESIL